MKTTRDRYEQDPIFRTLVDVVRRGIRENQFTPSEVREAAVLAAYLEEMERPAPRWWHMVEKELQAAPSPLSGRAHGACYMLCGRTCNTPHADSVVCRCLDHQLGWQDAAPARGTVT